MTTIINKHIGITHPLGDLVKDETFCEAWKQANCSQGIHALNEVFELTNAGDVTSFKLSNKHYLHCDICGIEVHIEKIIIPDGENKVVK